MKIGSFIPVVLAVLLVVLGTTAGVLLFNMNGRIRALEAELTLHEGLEGRMGEAERSLEAHADATQALQAEVASALERLQEREMEAAELATATEHLQARVDQLERAEARSLERLAALEAELELILGRLGELD